jgi:hypothetical protein
MTTASQIKPSATSADHWLPRNKNSIPVTAAVSAFEPWRGDRYSFANIPLKCGRWRLRSRRLIRGVRITDIRVRLRRSGQN